MSELIDQETELALREEGLADALWGKEEHTIRVVTYLDGEVFEDFTLLDWWTLEKIGETVLRANRRFNDESEVLVRVTDDSGEVWQSKLEGAY